MSTPALQDVPPPLPAVEHEDAIEACRPERGRKRKRRGAKKMPRPEEAERRKKRTRKSKIKQDRLKIGKM